MTCYCNASRIGGSWRGTATSASGYICLGASPRIIDCLEFRRDLRLHDPVNELAFLAMECERLGDRSIGHMLFHYYSQRPGVARHRR
ncbi:MAG: hypothetical protein J2P48_19140 [Alphaproteobacteria bacterium]|nr:hypothetical protein [Alphaproteobacteria bacterium]